MWLVHRRAGARASHGRRLVHTRPPADAMTLVKADRGFARVPGMPSPAAYQPPQPSAEASPEERLHAPETGDVLAPATEPARSASEGRSPISTAEFRVTPM